MEISETTGLPALPEGYFWRVVPTHNIYDGRFVGVKLQLIETRKGWFRTHRTVLREVGHSIEGTPEEVREGLKQQAEALYEWFVRADEALEFVGVYPPKTINN